MAVIYDPLFFDLDALKEYFPHLNSIILSFDKTFAVLIGHMTQIIGCRRKLVSLVALCIPQANGIAHCYCKVVLPSFKICTVDTVRMQKKCVVIGLKIKNTTI